MNTFFRNPTIKHINWHIGRISFQIHLCVVVSVHCSSPYCIVPRWENTALIKIFVNRPQHDAASDYAQWLYLKERGSKIYCNRNEKTFLFQVKMHTSLIILTWIELFRLGLDIVKKTRLFCLFVFNWAGLKPRQSPNKGVRPRPFSC